MSHDAAGAAAVATQSVGASSYGYETYRWLENIAARTQSSAAQWSSVPARTAISGARVLRVGAGAAARAAGRAACRCPHACAL